MRWFRFLALVAVCSASDCDNAAAPPATRHLTVVAGNGQTDTVGLPVATPYEVLVSDAAGAPQRGVAVAWSITAGGGSFDATETTTDAAGHARATHRLGTVTGLQSARAQVTGALESPLTFTTLAVAAAPAQAVKSSGDRQAATSGTALAAPYAVRVTDAFGNPTANVTVAFTARGGSVSSSTVLTTANGIATTTHTLGSGSGPDTVLAIVPTTDDTLVFVSYAIATIPVLNQVPVPANYGLHDTFVRDGIAFACVWNTGVIIYDVGDGRAGGTPAAPVAIDTILTDASIAGGRQAHNAWWFYNPVLNEKRYLFVGQEGPGAIGSSSSGDIHVVDVSDFNNPVEVASYRLAGAGTHNFWVDEAAQVLYAAYYNGGVVAINVAGELTGNLATREIARIQPGGAGNTYTWGVQLHTNGSIYAVDMLSGVWQLRRTSTTFTVAGGGNNVPERFGSDLWVHGDYLYSGTWGSRSGNPGNTVKIWHLDAGGAPALVGTIVVPNISTVSDLQVSADGQVLVFSAEGGTGAGLYVYGLIDPQNPIPLARATGISLHTATVSDIGGRRDVFAAKNPSLPAMAIFDITDYVP
jgi:hypothetical protein